VVEVLAWFAAAFVLFAVVPLFEAVVLFADVAVVVAPAIAGNANATTSAARDGIK
jgi:hypothetical protein